MRRLVRAPGRIGWRDATRPPAGKDNGGPVAVRGKIFMHRIAAVSALFLLNGCQALNPETRQAMPTSAVSGNFYLKTDPRSTIERVIELMNEEKAMDSIVDDFPQKAASLITKDLSTIVEKAVKVAGEQQINPYGVWRRDFRGIAGGLASEIIEAAIIE